MRIPLLKQGDDLIAIVPPSANDSDLEQLREELLAMVCAVRARGVVIDVTSLDVLDSFASRSLTALCQMVKLRGADAVVVGIQPEVAFAMVQLGLTLPHIATALDLEEGLQILRRRENRGPTHGT